MFFILGNMLFANSILRETIRKQGGWFLAGAMIFSAFHLILKFNMQLSLYYFRIPALAAILVIYELLVSRIGVLKFLFGMRSKTIKPRITSPAV
jgi:hypothetical protein